MHRNTVKNYLKLRMKFARKINRKLPKNFWTYRIEFYLNEVSFTHKTKPFDQARAPKTMAWGRSDQGIDFRFSNLLQSEAVKGLLEVFPFYDFSSLWERCNCGGRINAEKLPSFIR